MQVAAKGRQGRRRKTRPFPFSSLFKAPLPASTAVTLGPRMSRNKEKGGKGRVTPPFHPFLSLKRSLAATLPITLPLMFKRGGEKKKEKEGAASYFSFNQPSSSHISSKKPTNQFFAAELARRRKGKKKGRRSLTYLFPLSSARFSHCLCPRLGGKGKRREKKKDSYYLSITRIPAASPHIGRAGGQKKEGRKGKEKGKVVFPLFFILTFSAFTRLVQLDGLISAMKEERRRRKGRGKEERRYFLLDEPLAASRQDPQTNMRSSCERCSERLAYKGMGEKRKKKGKRGKEGRPIFTSGLCPA